METLSLKDLSLIETEDVSLSVEHIIKSPDAIIIAPHGGNIEFGTTQIARYIASDTYSFYSFVCNGTREKCAQYHISSHLFDEPKGLMAVAGARIVISIHGMKGESENIVVGGLLESNLLIQKLCSVGFHAESAEKYPAISGIDPSNICNRGVLARGTQIEISDGLRRSLLSDKRLLKSLKKAVDDFIKSV